MNAKQFAESLINRSKETGLAVLVTLADIERAQLDPVEVIEALQRVSFDYEGCKDFCGRDYDGALEELVRAGVGVK